MDQHQESELMNDEEKLQLLRSINREELLREKVLMPLLEKMRLSPVLRHGGLPERGIDIVCSEKNALEFDEWVSFVAKIGRITAQTTGTSGVATVLNQVYESFRYPYKNSISKRENPINKVIIVTNDEILTGAQDKIFDALKQSGPGFANVHFLPVKRLKRLITAHCSELWTTLGQAIAHDYLTDHAAQVLLILVETHKLYQTTMRKRPKMGLTLETIRKRTGFTHSEVESILSYLRREHYIEKTYKGTFRVHSREIDTILIEPNQARLLLTLSEHADEYGCISEKRIYILAKKNQFQFTDTYTKAVIAKLKKGKYIKREISRAELRFEVNNMMIEDELPYLHALARHEVSNK